ncbi:unnamed protein product [Mucor circinelloides]
MLDVDEIPEKPNVNTLDSVISGLFGGLAGLAVGHPFGNNKLHFTYLMRNNNANHVITHTHTHTHKYVHADTVKVRLQSRELASRYKGTWNCFVTTIKQEKFVGLYKGMVI